MARKTKQAPPLKAPAPKGLGPTSPPEPPAPDAAPEADAASPFDDVPEPSEHALRVALAEPRGYQTERVDIHLRDWRRQAGRGLNALRQGLRDKHARLSNGKEVQSLNDAVLWLGEQLETCREH